MDNNLGPFLLLFIILIAWSVIWKGMALWKAAQRKELTWFVALLLVNTLGILDILYLYVFSKESPTSPHRSSASSSSSSPASSSSSGSSGNSTPPTVA